MESLADVVRQLSGDDPWLYEEEVVPTASAGPGTGGGMGVVVSRRSSNAGIETVRFSVRSAEEAISPPAAPPETVGCSAEGVDLADHVSAHVSLRSKLSCAAKSTVPLASGIQAFALSSVVFMPNVYITLFHGDARLIGLANILDVPLVITLLPLIGQLSDAAFFNKGAFRDVESWGRRSPLLLLSIPLCMFSCVLFWVGPESLGSALAVALWFAAARFLLTLGVAMFESSFQAGFTELFPSRSERVNVGLAKFVALSFGFGLGTAAIAPIALGMREPGSPSQRKTFAIFGILTGACWLLAIPFACVQRRSLMKRVEPRSFFWSSFREFWRSSPAFRRMAVSSHFYAAGFQVTLAALPFYFEVVLQYAPAQIESAMRIVTLAAVTFVPISLPVVAFLSKRMDTSMISGISGLLMLFIGACHAHATHGIPGRFWPQVIQTAVLCGSGVAALGVSWASSQSVLSTWIVDDDQVRRAEQSGALRKANLNYEDIPARRDGMINSLKTAFTFTGQIWAGLFLFVLGALGYDGASGSAQPAEVCAFIEVTYILLVPGMFVMFALPMLRFPLRGQRLKQLMGDYARLHDRLADSGLEVAEQPSGLEVAEQPSGLEVAEQPSGLEVAEQPSGLEVAEQPSGLEVAEQPASTPQGELGDLKKRLASL